MALTNEFEVEVYGELILYQNQIKKILEEYFEMKGIPAQLESSGKDLTIHTHENNFKDFPWLSKETTEKKRLRTE